MRRTRPILKRIGLGLLIAVVVLIAAGATYEAIGAARDRRASAPPGELIDVGDGAEPLRLHLYCTGAARAGQPTVILEALSGGWWIHWGWVQAELAQNARVCSYDRAGFGWSDPPPHFETLAQNAAALRTLLERGGEQRPYVLVGHSKGGLFARQYAASYPDEVAGLVLLDSSHPEQFERHPAMQAETDAFLRQSRPFPLLARLGLFRLATALGFHFDFGGMPPRERAQMVAAFASPEYWATSRADMAASPALFGEAQALPPLGDLPLVVISAGTGTADGWAALQEELATLSTAGTHVTLDEATHVSLVFDPEHARAVSTEILRLVDRAAAR
jgi:pimeloyl-ACP methyl ester carboxylesterase